MVLVRLFCLRVWLACCLWFEWCFDSAWFVGCFRWLLGFGWVRCVGVRGACLFCVMVVMVSVCFPTVLFGCRLVY